MITIAFLACGDFLRAAETPVDFRTVRDAVLFGPMPELYLAWMKSASCIVHMVVDPTTGNVTNVYVVESSGDAHLNSHVVDALRRWKFRPGTPGLIRISFGEERVAPQRWFAPLDREAKHMDKMLAPFLGKRGLVRGELPDYPSTPAWTNKHGTGVFELACRWHRKGVQREYHEFLGRSTLRPGHCHGPAAMAFSTRSHDR